MIDSTPHRRRRARARASIHGGTAEQVQLPVDERSAAERLDAAIQQTYDNYHRAIVQRRGDAR